MMAYSSEELWFNEHEHVSLLRTVQDNFGLPHLEPANFAPITDVWQTVPFAQ